MSAVDDLRAPFPWYGGKSKVAGLVWDRFGNVPNYVEPFFGSGAVLLGRPHPPGIETVNDLDCMVANFWRALQHDPEAVAHHADNPVNEADQHARHLWLCSQEEFRERMKVDPEYYDSKIAGWWVWGQSIWIGSGWCSVQLPHLGNAGKGMNRQLPHLGNAGMGLHRKLPHLGDAGMGLHRQLPHLGDAGMGPECVSVRTLGTRDGLVEYLSGLADRLRNVRVCCGDWARVCGPSPTVKLGTTGVFLDPPYASKGDRCETLYASEDLTVAHAVREWAVEWGDDPRMRIALCGYEGEHAMPDSWQCIPWKARGGYGSQGDGQGRANAGKERIWFSPHCLQPGLFRDDEMFSTPKPDDLPALIREDGTRTDEWCRMLGEVDLIIEDAIETVLHFGGEAERGAARPNPWSRSAISAEPAFRSAHASRTRYDANLHSPPRPGLAPPGVPGLKTSRNPHTDSCGLTPLKLEHPANCAASVLPCGSAGSERPALSFDQANSCYHTGVRNVNT